MFDWQTRVALVIVVLAGFVVAYRSVLSVKRALYGSGAEASGCGMCDRCPSRKSGGGTSITREPVVVTLRPPKSRVPR